MQAVNRRFQLLVLLVFEMGTIVVLHRLGRRAWMEIPWSDIGSWLETTSAEDALASTIRLVALAIAYWMLGSTVLYLIARLSQIPASLRGAEWATIPAVRRVVDGAVAFSIATASIAGPAAPAIAEAPPPVVVEIDEQGWPIPPGPHDEDEERDAPSDTTAAVVPRGLDRLGWTPRPSGVPADPGTPNVAVATTTRHEPRTRRQTLSHDVPPASVVVEKGDHLWAISKRRVELASGGVATNEGIAGYWRTVVEANRHRLRSGNPDLIYPGETVMLPPLTVEDE